MVSEKRDSLSRDSNALGGVQQPVFPTGLLFPKSPYVIPSLFLLLITSLCGLPL